MIDETAVPIARFPSQLNPYLDRVATPYFARLLPGPRLEEYLTQIAGRRANNLRGFIAQDIAFAFAYFPDLNAKPQALLVVDSLTMPRNAPPGHDFKWVVANFYSWWGESTDRAMRKQIRNRFLWLIYDGLRLAPEQVSDLVLKALHIPDIVSTANAMPLIEDIDLYRHLRNLQKKHADLSHLLDLAQRALTLWTHEKGGPRDQYRMMTGQHPTAEHLLVLVNRLHSVRTKIFLTTYAITSSLFTVEPHNYSKDNIAEPSSSHKIKIGAGEVTMIVEPDDDESVWTNELVWTIWLELEHADLKHTAPLSASTRGPIEALVQAELIIEGHDAFDAWLDANQLPGELLFDPTPYDLVDAEPLFWEPEKFLRWAKSEGMTEALK